MQTATQADIAKFVTAKSHVL